MYERERYTLEIFKSTFLDQKVRNEGVEELWRLFEDVVRCPWQKVWPVCERQRAVDAVDKLLRRQQICHTWIHVRFVFVWGVM